MKNKIAVIVCLVACLTIAASSEYQKKGLEERVSELEWKYQELYQYWLSVNSGFYRVAEKQVDLQRQLGAQQRHLTAFQYQIWNINWFLCANFDGCTNAVSPPTP